MRLFSATISGLSAAAWARAGTGARPASRTTRDAKRSARRVIGTTSEKRRNPFRGKAVYPVIIRLVLFSLPPGGGGWGGDVTLPSHPPPPPPSPTRGEGVRPDRV